jgi:hypothetical protein
MLRIVAARPSTIGVKTAPLRGREETPPAPREKHATQISAACVVGEVVVPDGTDADGSLSIGSLCQLGGFMCPGRLRSQRSWRASGQGLECHRVRLRAAGLRWEAFVRLREDPS